MLRVGGLLRGNTPVADNARAIGRINGAFDAILSAMRTHIDVAGVQNNACGALMNLALNDGTTCVWRALHVERLLLVLTVGRA